VVGATDPNPSHTGKGFGILKHAGIAVTHGVLAEACERLNEGVQSLDCPQTPFVTVKAAMTLDGKIATAAGESKWITGEKARAYGMNCDREMTRFSWSEHNSGRRPSLTVRGGRSQKRLRRIILDSMAKTPLTAKVVCDEDAVLTTIVVGPRAPKTKVSALAKRVEVLNAPREVGARGTPLIPLAWLLKELGRRETLGLLVEGGGEVNAVSQTTAGASRGTEDFWSEENATR